MLIKLSLLAVFGIAMAHFEGVVVVYLRKALGMPDSESNKESVEKFPKRYLIHRNDKRSSNNNNAGCNSFSYRFNLG